MFLNQHRLDYWVKTHWGPTFDPTTLFVGGQTGGWWNPADHTTTWQDTAGTTPANTAGQSVARIDDKSGNGNNLIGTGAAGTHPVLRNSGALWWLEFRTASSQFMQFGPIVFNQPTTRISAINLITWSCYMCDGLATNQQALQASVGVSPEVSIYAGGSNIADVTNMTIGNAHATTEIFNGASSKLAIDNNAYATGNVGANDPQGFTLGSAGGFPTPFGLYADINWFGAIFIGKVLSDPDITSCRTFFGDLAGLSL